MADLARIHHSAFLPSGRARRSGVYAPAFAVGVAIGAVSGVAMLPAAGFGADHGGDRLSAPLSVQAAIGGGLASVR